MSLHVCDQQNMVMLQCYSIHETYCRHQKKFVLLVKALLFHVFQQIKLETLHNNMNLLYFK